MWHPSSSSVPAAAARPCCRRSSAAIPTIDAVVRDGVPVPELVYPYGVGRYPTEGGTPGICHMTLPMLTPDPDGLYDELAAEIPSWPPRPVPEQYQRLFTWL